MLGVAIKKQDSWFCRVNKSQWDPDALSSLKIK